ncbi:hypothetical protein C0V73_22745 [Rhizobium sp. TH135]|uniref:hypothetical protein n=1 Tax=Rhizobium sp. TH135 TaxID=2067451 RepID=UPI000C7DE6F1|nr:hypothetical protein [Rhizobium sp. TH135]PLK68691.1 hypothetical protein C0V73_22745 [Rhizobium sp. TH135]
MPRILAALCFLSLIALPASAFDNQRIVNAGKVLRAAGFETMFESPTLGYVGTSGNLRIHQFDDNLSVIADQNGNLEDHKAICAIVLAHLGGVDPSFAAPAVDRVFDAQFAGHRDVAKAGGAWITVVASNDRFVECQIRAD